jgi:hypothetical protein
METIPLQEDIFGFDYKSKFRVHKANIIKRKKVSNPQDENRDPGAAVFMADFLIARNRRRRSSSFAAVGDGSR